MSCPSSRSVGALGKPPSRSRVQTLSRRNSPASTCGRQACASATMSIWRPSSAVTPSCAPRNGTCSISTPTRRSRSSIAMWFDVAMPLVE